MQENSQLVLEGQSAVCAAPTQGLVQKGQETAVVRGDVVLLSCLTALFAGITLIWFLLDHHFPGPDEAGHVITSLVYKGLWAHFHPTKAAWWHTALTATCYYPPAVHIFNGFLRLIFGPSRFVDVGSMIFFNVLLSVSIYSIVRFLSFGRTAAALAVCLINLYPGICWLGHTFLLDLPLVSVIAMGIAALLWWQSAPSPKRTLITGLLLAVACMTKQLAVSYLAPIGLWMLLRHTGLLGGRRCLAHVKMLIAIAALVAAIGFPWLAANYRTISTLTNSMHDTLAANAHSLPLQNLPDYLLGLVLMASPFLFAIFLLSLPAVKVSEHKRLAPLALSASFGIVALSIWMRAAPANNRWILPALIVVAIYSAVALNNLWSKRLLRVPVTVVLLIAGLQFLAFNFAPYPFRLNILTHLPQALGVRYPHVNPQPEEDWGYKFVVETIRKVDKDPVFLNILANHWNLNARSFELAVKETNSSIRPVSSRVYGVLGDSVKFSPETALYFQWYLIKTGDSGCNFADGDSQRKFYQLVDFVETSPKFIQIATKKLPDDSYLKLYRQR